MQNSRFDRGSCFVSRSTLLTVASPNSYTYSRKSSRPVTSASRDATKTRRERWREAVLGSQSTNGARI